ncbi:MULTISPECIES: 2,3-diaminopropionate biosynthesis protein SbnA [Pseudoalteromonas]|nr:MULTISPECIES: 2,3-diaminopropionate biosynthesis protein SbnA [Pseudoalteromonas]
MIESEDTMIYDSVEQIIHDEVFLSLADFLPQCNVFLKMENFNAGGSIKMKTAVSLISDAERNKNLRQIGRLIESSSGNLGLALSVVCAAKGYEFTCVVDKNTLPASINLMEKLGTKVVIIDKKDSGGGYLQSRLEYVRSLIASDQRLVWLNQYHNTANKQIHEDLTAASIIKQFPNLDYLFVGAGTTGTLMGCVAAFKSHSAQTKIIAVDSVGSAIFGTMPGERHIPGLGSSVSPPLFSREGIDAFIQIPEIDTIQVCRELASSKGLMCGGSTGTVLAGVREYASKIPAGANVVAISPDYGERYLNTIYDDAWVNSKYQLNSME